MPLPEKYYQKLIERRDAAERASRWDEWRELAAYRWGEERGDW